MTSEKSRLDLYAVVTMRGIAASKSRLSGALALQDRMRLNRWLLDRTLAMLRDWRGGLERCVLVSPCEQARAIAARAGAVTVAEPGGARGHNHAARLGLDHAVARGAATVMMLPCDLPDLSSQALEAFAACARAAQLVLAPDRHGTGTNALIAPCERDLTFHFGDDSRTRFTAWAQGRAWRVAVHCAPELAFDLDTPDDYARWRGRGDKSLPQQPCITRSPRAVCSRRNP